MSSTGNATPNMSPKFVPAQEGRKFFAPGTVLQQKLASSETGNQFSVHYSEVQPGFGPPPHIHTLEDEVFYVIEGQIEFTVGDTKQIATPGTTVFGPRGTMHTFRGVGDTVSKMVGFVTGSNFEKFYSRVEEALMAENPDMAELKRITEEHGIILM